jgi:hypothetical protein
MKYIKYKNLILIILTVLLLFSSSFVSYGTSINKANDKNNLKVTGFNIRSSTVAIKLDSQKIGTTILNIDDNDDRILDIESFDDLKNIVVANSSHHEYYPSMVLNGRDCLVAYERLDNGKPYIYLTKSNDYGQNWSEVPEKLTLKESGDELFVNSPSLCIKPYENEAYGVFLSSLVNTGVIGALIIPDISKFGGISYFVLNFSIIPDGPGEYTSFWDFSCPDIVYHYKNNVPWIIGYTGSTNYSTPDDDYSSKDSLMFLYQDSRDPDIVWLQWDHTIENCYNLSIATNEESKKFYGICEKKNGSNQDLLFFTGTYKQSGDQDPYLDIILKNISANMSHKHPKIIVKDDDIFVVSEINIGGITDDILIYHSSDEGENWDEIDPTGNNTSPPGVFVPKFPLISVNSTHLVCTLIEDKNLYLTQSNNLDLNWSEPIRINNADFTVVENHRYADMPDNKHIVWTDDRAANLDIYSISKGIPRLNLMIVPGSLILNATKNPYFSTYNSIKFKVKNTGEDYAEDVLIEITINRTDQQPYNTKYPGFIKYLKTGAEVELKQPLFEMTLKGYVYAVSDLENIDYINVSIIPSSDFQDSDPSDNIESIYVTFEDIFPLLSQRPLLVTLFKLLALVL